MEPLALAEDVRHTIGEIGGADIVVGIPSFNNARTISHVVRAVKAGLAKYFPDRKAVLVNSDGGSSDGTREVVLNTSFEDYQSILVNHRSTAIFKFATPYHGIPGKGSAFRTIFEIARRLGAKACAVVDSDLRSITPEWIELLLKPVMSGRFDYVAPLYHRHKYDGTITNSIVYPVTRALYGRRVRQPIGGDFGFSGDLASFYLDKDVWGTDVARYGIDIWMTTSAIANGFRICQSFLGAKIHDAKDPGVDLSNMLYQVVGATFGLMESYRDVWVGVKGSEPVETFGFNYTVGLEPVNVNRERMVESFRLGVDGLLDLWKGFFPRNLLRSLRELREAPEEGFSMPDEIWADIVYSFALAYHHNVMNREHLLKSFTPLYVGRTASWVAEVRESDMDEVEARIERLCAVFEERKGRLATEW